MERAKSAKDKNIVLRTLKNMVYARTDAAGYQKAMVYDSDIFNHEDLREIKYIATHLGELVKAGEISRTFAHSPGHSWYFLPNDNVVSSAPAKRKTAR